MEKISPRETSRIFTRSLSCSQALMTALDSAMGHKDEVGERAAHPLAGGLIHMGYQCGMIWGATLAAGSEALRRFGAGPAGESAATHAAQAILKSFQNHTGQIDCREITRSNFLTFSGRIKYLLTGKAVGCARMAVKWAPQACGAINEALENFGDTLLNSRRIKIGVPEIPGSPVSCSSALARKIGATDDEAVMVAGFAGGIGLSGDACGALGAAIWITTLRWYRAHPEVNENFARALKQEFSQNLDFYPAAKAIRDKFKKVTGGKYLCREIAGRNFNSIPDHADFLKSGGCSDLISAGFRL